MLMTTTQKLRLATPISGSKYRVHLLILKRIITQDMQLYFSSYSMKEAEKSDRIRSGYAQDAGCCFCAYLSLTIARDECL
jgi:hypothetical protein